MKRRYYPFALCGLLLLIGAVALGIRMQATAAPSATVPPPTPPGTVFPARPTAPLASGFPVGPPPTPGTTGTSLGDGSPAITPHIATTDPSVPTFTLADATDYVTHHPKVATDGTPITVGTGEFLTARQLAVKYKIDETLNVPANRLLCVVPMDGNFRGGGAPGSPVVTLHHAYAVFDAHTGNLVVVGVFR
jgi:hypothetical protein